MPSQPALTGALPGCPYFYDQFLGRTPISLAVKMHLSCERIMGNTSANPYAVRSQVQPFHVTFYEKLDLQGLHDLDLETSDSETMKTESQWKIGEYAYFQHLPSTQNFTIKYLYISLDYLLMSIRLLAGKIILALNVLRLFENITSLKGNIQFIRRCAFTVRSDVPSENPASDC